MCDKSNVPEELREDLQHADTLIARAVTKASWDANAKWVNKFQQYVVAKCPKMIKAKSEREVLLDKHVALAFLASVSKEDPSAKTRVDAAKRAVNLLRSIADQPPLSESASIAMFARAARNPSVSTRRQSPGLPPLFVAAIASGWGTSKVWWKRQVAVMITLAYCALARGAGITSCVQFGFAWVRIDGTLIHDTSVIPHGSNCLGIYSARGVLLLLPYRKNKQHEPTWIPISDPCALKLFAAFLRWRAKVATKNKAMFPARRSARRNKARCYIPATGVDQPMTTDTLRVLIRQACVECCNLPPHLARQIGTHSIKIGALERLRSRSVPAELRQQLGGWMSQTVALNYMQLAPAAQFDILGSL